MEEKKSNAAKMLFKNIEKRRAATRSETPTISMDVETAANVSVALRTGGDPYIFPFYGANGATVVDNAPDGRSILAWLDEKGEVVLSLTFPNRETALHFADGFETAATQVAESPDQMASAKIRTDIATFFVTATIAQDDPRRASGEQMQAFIAKLPSNVRYHEEPN